MNRWMRRFVILLLFCGPFTFPAEGSSFSSDRACGANDDGCQKARRDGMWLETWGRLPGEDPWLELVPLESNLRGGDVRRWQVLAWDGAVSVGEAVFSAPVGGVIPLDQRSEQLANGRQLRFSLDLVFGVLRGSSNSEFGVSSLAMTIEVNGERKILLRTPRISSDVGEMHRVARQAADALGGGVGAGSVGGGGLIPEVFRTGICREDPETWGHLDSCGLEYCSCDAALGDQAGDVALACGDSIYHVFRNCLDGLDGEPDILDWFDCFDAIRHAIEECTQYDDFQDQLPGALAACRSDAEICYCESFTQYHYLCNVPVRGKVTGLVAGESVSLEAKCQGGANPATEEVTFDPSGLERELVHCAESQSYSVRAFQVFTPGVFDEFSRHCLPVGATSGQISEAGPNGPLVEFDCSCRDPRLCPRIELFASVTGLDDLVSQSHTVELGLGLRDQGARWEIKGSTTTDTPRMTLAGPAQPGVQIETFLSNMPPACDYTNLIGAGSVPEPAPGQTSLQFASVTCDPEACRTPGECQIQILARVHGNGFPRPGGVNATVDVDGHLYSVTLVSNREQNLGVIAAGTTFAGATITNPTVETSGINVTSYCSLNSPPVGTIDGGSPFVLLDIECQREKQYVGPGGGNGRPRPDPMPGDPFRWIDCFLYCPPGESAGGPGVIQDVCWDHDNDPSTQDRCERTEVTTVTDSACYFVCPGGPVGRFAPRLTVNLGSDQPKDGDRVVTDEWIVVAAAAQDPDGLQGFLTAIDGRLVSHQSAGGHATGTLTPGAIDTSGLPPGDHVLEVIALDNEAQYPIPAIATFPFTVDRMVDPCAADATGPAIAFSAPIAQGAQLPLEDRDVFAEVTDPNGVDYVQFYVDGTYQSSDGNWPYQFAWSPQPGVRVLRARAADECGNATERDVVVSVADPCAGLPWPQVQLTGYTDGQSVDPALFHFSAQATDHSGQGIANVTFKVGSFAPFVVGSAPWQSSGYYLVTEGAVRIEARAYDGCGRQATHAITLHIDEDSSVCGIDQGPPVVTIDAPAPGASLAPGPLTISAHAVDDTTLYAWALWIDGLPVDSALVGTTSYQWVRNFGTGTHTIEARAVDVCMKTGRASVSVNVTGAPLADLPLEPQGAYRLLDGPIHPPGPPVDSGKVIDFGAILPGQTGSPRTVSILNDGRGELRVTAVQISGTAFALVGSPTFPLSVPGWNGEANLALRATGQGTGVVEEWLTVQHDGPGGVYTAKLRVNVDPVDGHPFFFAPVVKGFETGDLTGWTGTYGTPPTVTAPAALQGKRGLDVSFDGVSGQTFIFSTFPAEKALVRSRFLFDPNSVQMPEGTLQSIAAMVSTGTPIGWLQLRRIGAGFEIRTVARRDDASQVATPWLAIADGPETLTFDWWAASAPGANNGGIRVRRTDGTASELRNVDNDQQRSERFRLGALWGVVDASEGHLFFDSVVILY